MLPNMGDATISLRVPPLAVRRVLPYPGKTMRTLPSCLFVVVTLTGSPVIASWWCATSGQREERCWASLQTCKSMESQMAWPWFDCREVETVTILEFTQVNSGRMILGFPLLSQCERTRKLMTRNKVDYREFSKCYSSALLASGARIDRAPASPGALDLPGGSLAALAERKDWLVVNCRPVQPPTRPARARCQIMELDIKEFDGEEIERRQEKQAAEWATELTDATMRVLCEGWPKDSSPRSETNSERVKREVFATAVKDACAAKDRARLTEIFLDAARETDRACRASVTLDEREFKRVDANTWTSSNGGMEVITLWRDKADGPGPGHWNYKEVVRNPPGNLIPAGLNYDHEYSWRSYLARDVGCPTMFGPQEFYSSPTMGGTVRTGR